MDRCDTPPYYFLHTADGRPFFYCLVDPNLNKLVSEFRRKFAYYGASFSVREGNYAAATMDEARAAWPRCEPTFATDGSFVYFVPHDVQEREDEDRSVG